jgi:flagellin-like hook-associated protein FlgL
MTIWFSTNIPEMRAISTFNRVSTDISDIQHRITTGQRINSGKDDPGGLIIREGLRADIKNIQATQANMTQADILLEKSSDGMLQLLEIIRGSDTKDETNSGILGQLLGSLDFDQKKAVAQDFMKLYDAAVATTTYGTKVDGGETKPLKLLGGDLADTAKVYQLGDGVGKLEVKIKDLSSASGGAAEALKTAIAAIADDDTLQAAVDAARGLLDTISTELGTIGGQQKVVGTNMKLLDSRLTSVSSAEGRISNADIAAESSRMARAELLAQNAMSSILYTRSYAAFAVGSLFG